jgi:sugar lactone lactonase YvrE
MLLALAAPLPAVDMLYVTLTNNTIVTYDTTGNVGTTIAASVNTFASTNLNVPTGLAFDSSGNLYAANTGNSTISKFNSSGVYQSNITSNLNSPIGLAFDSSGNLYAANSTSKTISKFDSSGTFLTSWSTGATAIPKFLAFKPVTVPEPSTYALATIATGVMAYLARRRKARTA